MRIWITNRCPFASTKFTWCKESSGLPDWLDSNWAPEFSVWTFFSGKSYNRIPIDLKWRWICGRSVIRSCCCDSQTVTEFCANANPTRQTFLGCEMWDKRSAFVNTLIVLLNRVFWSERKYVQSSVISWDCLFKWYFASYGLTLLF